MSTSTKRMHLCIRDAAHEAQAKLEGYDTVLAPMQNQRRMLDPCK